jgi:HEAT repeat protein
MSADIAADALGSDDPELVVACLRLIDTVGSSRQADAVRPLIEHPAFFVRAETATVLGHIGDSRDVETIASMVESASPWIATRSARALLDLGQRGVLEELSAGQGTGRDSAREVLHEAGAA